MQFVNKCMIDTDTYWQRELTRQTAAAADSCGSSTWWVPRSAGLNTETNCYRLEQKET